MKLGKKFGMFFIFTCVVPVAIMLAILLNQNATNIREVNKREVERTVGLVNKIATQELEKGFISLDYLKSVALTEDGKYQSQNALYDISRNSRNFKKVYMINNESKNIDSYPKDGTMDSTIIASEWYKKARSNNKYIYVSEFINVNADSYLLTVSKSIVRGGIPVGVAAVDIDLSLAFAELDGREASQIASYVIIDKNTGKVVFPSHSKLGKDFINEIIGNESTFEKSELFKTKDKGIVSYYKQVIEGTDWVIVGEFSMSALKVTYEASKNILYVSLAIIIFLSFFSVFIFESMMVGPLVQVKEKFIQASGGNFGTRIFVDSHDEIGDLAAEFNLLMKKISKKVKNIEEGMTKGLSKDQIEADIELEDATNGLDYAFEVEKPISIYDYKNSSIQSKRINREKENIQVAPAKKVEIKSILEAVAQDENFDNPIVEEDENFKKQQRELIHRTFDEWRGEYFKTLEEKKKKQTQNIENV